MCSVSSTEEMQNGFTIKVITVFFFLRLKGKIQNTIFLAVSSIFIFLCLLLAIGSPGSSRSCIYFMRSKLEDHVS